MRTNIFQRRLCRRPPLVGLMTLVMLASVAGTQLAGAQSASPTPAPAGAEKQAVVSVKGMQCPFCAYGIQKHLKKLPGATDVQVELAKNEATVTFEPDAEVTNEQIEEVVRKAGFTPGDITWKSGKADDTTAKAGTK